MKFEIARAEQTRNQTENMALSKECEALKHANCNLLEVQRQLVRQKEDESNRHTENKNEQSRAETTLAAKDCELQALSRDLDAIRMSNESLLDQGHCYKQELLALQSHANVLAGQNNDLQKELDEFVATDEIIRNGLDRKGRV